jgi:mannose-6-phosphate isomerase-like protein (cupin superfamily)
MPDVGTDALSDMVREAILYPALTILDLAAEGRESVGDYRNVVINRVNESCLRLAAFVGEYRWHRHPSSDEFFLVVAGQLEIDLAEGRTLRLLPWQGVTIPAGTVHRTRAVGRTVNLCFEHLVSETEFVEPSDLNPPEPS